MDERDLWDALSYAFRAAYSQDQIRTLKRFLFNTVKMLYALGYRANILCIDDIYYIWFPGGIRGTYLESLLMYKGYYDRENEDIYIGIEGSIDPNILTDLSDIICMVREYKYKGGTD